jgi:D-sedoheptulose 7-phosphate isomerase
MRVVEEAAGLNTYLAGFVRALERVEMTTGQGASLSIDEGIDAVVERVMSVKKSGGKALLIGNGGSAAIVSHVHNDLCKSVGVRAIVFNETPLLTAVANDHGYHEVFCRPLELWADRHDLLIAVSSSGESANIVNAATLAKQMGCRVVTFSGFGADNRLRKIGDVNVYVPASSYGHVEMVHSVIAHCISDLASTRGAGTA